MPIVQWEDSYLLGVKEFDGHHMHLVSLLNQAYDLYVEGTDATKLADLLEALADYATYHFSAEEDWMLKLGYPGRDAHIGEHERFMLRLSDLNRHLRQGSAHLSLELVSFLRNWLIGHILEVDAQYGAFLRSGPYEDMIASR